jgi:hypothetical protein
MPICLRNNLEPALTFMAIKVCYVDSVSEHLLNLRFCLAVCVLRQGMFEKLIPIGMKAVVAAYQRGNFGGRQNRPRAIVGVVAGETEVDAAGNASLLPA